jgi:hypothetical protein
MTSSKKAQATAFMILGLIIISSAILVYYFRAEIFEGLGNQILKEEPISEQIQKVKTYTSECIEETLEEGALIMGLQAGHISLPRDEFPPLGYNMLSNSIDMFNNGAFKIPYWSYQTPNGLDKTQIPTKQEMEQELANYLDTNIDNCLNNYIPFILDGYDIHHANPSSEVIITDNTINAETDFLINIAYKEKQQTFDKFKTRLNIPLGKLYSDALELLQYENQENFIEKATLDLMVTYDEIPFSGVDFECSPKTWLKSKLIQDLKSIMALNIPTLKIKGTNYLLKDDKDKILVHNALSNPDKDTSINFLFSSQWPIGIDIIGEDNEIIKGKPFTLDNEASRFLLPLFCLNDYHFVYDLKYPVLFSLTENEYTFQFGVMGIIDNNQPKKNTAEFQMSYLEDDPICSRGVTPITVIATGISSDGSSVPMDDVDISLKCVTGECDIGTTRLTSAGIPSLTEYFPQCINGQIIASKEGYHSVSETVSTNREFSISLDLETYYELPVDVLVSENGAFRTPYPTEQILFQFENVDQNYYTSYYYPSQEKLKLISGDYLITSTLIVETEGGFNFPSKTVQICVDVPKKGIGGMLGITNKKCENQEIPKINLDAITAGGGSLSWHADRRALATSNKIALYTVRGKAPQSITELNSFNQNIEMLSKSIKHPTFE